MAETKLLLDEYPLIVLPGLAVAVGLNEAIVLQQIHYWLENFKRTESALPEDERPHFRDGRWWVYNSVTEWQEQFPFWSYITVKRVLESLKAPYTPQSDKDIRSQRAPLLLATCEYNKAKFDKTLWYTIDYTQVERLESLPEGTLDGIKMSPRWYQNEPIDGIKMSSSMVSKRTDRRAQIEPIDQGKMSQPIPETTTETTTEITQETTTTESSRRDEKKTPRPKGNDVVVDVIVPDPTNDSLLKEALADTGIKGQKKQEIPRLNDPPTGNDVVVDVVVPEPTEHSLLKEALADTGIKGRKKQEILRLDDPPHNWDVYGWAYYAYAQEWSSNPPGVIIEHLLDPDERHHPPQPFKQFGVEHLGPVVAARALAEAYRAGGYGYTEVVSSLGGDLQEEWSEYFGGCTPDELPLSNPAAAMWRVESGVLEAGLDRPAGPDVRQRWERAWQDFVARQLPGIRDLWSAVNATTTPLGYAADVLVVYVSDVVVRSTVEEHRPELEAAVGERIQFTAVELSVPEGDEEQEEESGPAVDDSVDTVIAGNWTAGRVWDAALGELQLQVAQATFDTRLRGSRLLKYEDGLFVVGVKDSGDRDWLENRLLSIVKRTLTRLAGQPVEVRFVAPED